MERIEPMKVHGYNCDCVSNEVCQLTVQRLRNEMTNDDLNCRTETGMPTKLAHTHVCTKCGETKLCEDFLLDRHNSPICDECAAIEDAHTLQLLTAGNFRNQTFSGLCSCGERSEWFSAAGLVHGWHGSHVEKVGA